MSLYRWRGSCTAAARVCAVFATTASCPCPSPDHMPASPPRLTTMNTASTPVRSHLLKLTLHDWPDADCLRILGAVRAAHAAAAGGKQASTAGQRLLIVDMVLPDRGPLGLSAASSDLQVMWPSAGAGGSLPAVEHSSRHAWPNQGHHPFVCSDHRPFAALIRHPCRCWRCWAARSAGGRSGAACWRRAAFGW